MNVDDRTKINACWKHLFELQRRIDRLEKLNPARVLTGAKDMSDSEVMVIWENLTVWFNDQRFVPSTTPCGMAERLLKFLGVSVPTAEVEVSNLADPDAYKAKRRKKRRSIKP